MTEQKKEYRRPLPGEPLGKVVHAHGEIMNDGEAVFMARLEQLLNIKGRVFIARFLAEGLRDPRRRPGIAADVARLLDPDNNASFKLEIVRQRRGRSPTKAVNDRAIAKAILKARQELGRKCLSKKEVGDIADRFEISDAKVRKVISQIRSKIIRD